MEVNEFARAILEVKYLHILLSTRGEYTSDIGKKDEKEIISSLFPGNTKIISPKE